MRHPLAADTLRLSAFTFLMHTIGLFYSVWLTKAVGIGTVGLLQLAAAAYGFGATLSCAGLRLAATQLVARAEAKKRSLFAPLRFCLRWGLCAGCLVGAGLFCFAKNIAVFLLKEPALAPALRCAAFALPFLAMTSALYGYYTAKGRILLLSVLQGLEQLFQIALAALFVAGKPAMSSAGAAFALMASSVAGEIFSFALACLFLPKQGRENPSAEPILRAFLRIVIPSGASAGVSSLLRSIQEIWIPAALTAWGLSRTQAVALYGEINGAVYPVLFFPAAVLTSLSIVIVPVLTKAYAVQNTARILSLTKRLLRLTLAFSFGCCGFLIVFSGEISLALFGDASYSAALLLFSPLVPLAYLDLIVDSVLRSIDRQLWATLCAVADAFFSVCLVRLLIPRFGLAGLAAAVLSAKLLNLFLSLLRLFGTLSLPIRPVKNVLLPIAAAGFFAKIASVLPARGSLHLSLLLRGALFCALYALLCSIIWSEAENRKEPLQKAAASDRR